MSDSCNVSPGNKIGRVAASHIDTTRSGKDRLIVTFEVDGEGRVDWHAYFTEAAWPITHEALLTLGFDFVAEGSDISKIDGTDALVGREAEIVCEEETNSRFGGGVRVKWINPLGAGTRRPCVDDLNQRIRQMVEGKDDGDGAA